MGICVPSVQLVWVLHKLALLGLERGMHGICVRRMQSDLPDLLFWGLECCRPLGISKSMSNVRRLFCRGLQESERQAVSH